MKLQLVQNNKGRTIYLAFNGTIIARHYYDRTAITGRMSNLLYMQNVTLVDL